MAADQDPVSWLLGNREIMVGVFMLIAWAMRKGGLTKEKENSAAKSQQPNTQDSEAFERTRRIQDEVRRKINERKNGGFTEPISIPSEREPLPPLMAPRPIASAPADMFGELLQRRFVDPEPIKTEVEAPDLELQATLERQKLLDAKIRELSMATREAKLSVAEQESNTAANEAFIIPQSRQAFSWISELRDPKNARRAMVLREVLNPPLALR